MILTCLATVLLLNPFEPEALLASQGFELTSSRASAAGGRIMSFENKSTGFVVQVKVLHWGADDPESTAKGLQDMYYNSLFSEPVNKSENLADRWFGVENAQSYCSSAEDMLTIAFGDFWTASVSFRDLTFEEPGERRMPPSEYREMAHNYARWKISQLEGRGEDEAHSRDGQNYTAIRRRGVLYAPIREINRRNSWNEKMEFDATKLTYQTRKGTLIVHVGSDAVEWNGELIRFGHIHPAQGDEVYLPVSFLDEKGL